MTHTPGPWQFTANMYGIDNMRVFGVEEINNGLTQGIANCGYGEGCEANARLIATAPELLSMVAALVGLLEDENGHHFVGEAIREGKALWEKASGETWKDEELEEDDEEDEGEQHGST